MAELTREAFQNLLGEQADPCISIYLPVVHVGSELQQNTIRLKNSLREVVNTLQARAGESAFAESDFDALITPIRDLDTAEFWEQPGAGLAIFRSPERFEYYFVDQNFDESVFVGKHFYLKPLLPLLTGEERFFVLALSQKAVRLIEADRSGVREVPLPGVVQNLEEALQYQPRQKLLSHTNATPGATSSSASAMHPGEFHGQGADVEDKKEDIQQFFHIVDRELHEVLRNQQAPLVLAAVEYLMPLWRATNSYKHLLASGITGNPEGFKPEELAQQARELVQPYFDRERQEAANRFYEKRNAGHASTDLAEIVQAACYGRVDTLFVVHGEQQFGQFDPMNGTVDIHGFPEPGDEDLLEMAATQTFANGGTVWNVPREQVPEQALVAAVMRY